MSFVEFCESNCHLSAWIPTCSFSCFFFNAKLYILMKLLQLNVLSEISDIKSIVIGKMNRN